MTHAHFLGVLGGMGPLATADFLRKVAENSPAQTDQEHIPILLYGDCTTPDRTANIVGSGPTPLPKLLAGIRFLCDAGVSAICIPCNSAHYWFAELEKASKVPLLHIAKASVGQVKLASPHARTVGVMSTLGTHQTGLYRDALAEQGYVVLSPTAEEFETLISPGIALIKANQVQSAETLFSVAANNMMQRGAEVIVLGCTEIPLGMKKQCELQPSTYVDSTTALALAAIDLFTRTSHC